MRRLIVTQDRHGRPTNVDIVNDKGERVPFPVPVKDIATRWTNDRRQETTVTIICGVETENEEEVPEQ